MFKTLSGKVCSRNGMVTVDIGSDTYELANIISNEATVEVSMYDLNTLNNTITEHYPVVASISGTLQARIDSGIWYEVFRHFMAYGKYPEITITTYAIDVAIPIAGVLPSRGTGLGQMVVRYKNVQLNSIDLPPTVTDDSTPFLEQSISWSANGIEFSEYFDNGIEATDYGTITKNVQNAVSKS